MQDNVACVEAIRGMATPVETGQYKPMTLKRHQEIIALAYRVKKLIDSEGGLAENEGCEFERYMQVILYLK